MDNLKFPPTTTGLLKMKDPVRHPQIQTVYEKEFIRNYSSTLKTLKINIIQLL